MTNNVEFFEEVEKLVLTPVSIRRVFLLLTRLHYSSVDNYGVLKEKLSNFLWSKDPVKRTLHIDYDYNYDAKELDRRPAIFVGLDDVEFKKVVTSNNAGFTEDRAGQRFTKTGTTHIIIRHIGKTADEALALGDLSSQFFMGITPMIRDTLAQKILEYEVVGLKSSRPFEKASQDADQHFISDLILGFSYNAVWLTSFESHRIKTISFKTSLADLTI